jgi:CubicO group peptidase (beta-lactamase class C family)
MNLEGHCDSEFDEVREVFSSHFEHGHEVGGAVAVYHRGKLVVDLAAGFRDRSSDQP